MNASPFQTGLLTERDTPKIATKAVIQALQSHPRFNASLDESGENLIIKKYFNLGIAMDTPNGLVVPVIKDVEQKSSPFQTGLLTERDTPKIATSGAFTMGVNCVPPMPPRLEIVNPAPCIKVVALWQNLTIS
jgi:hypothetical protein